MNARTLAIATGMLCAACSDSPRPGIVLASDAGCTGVAAVTLDDVYALDFASTSPTGCNGSSCHASATASGGLAFDTAAQLWAAAVNVPARLDPAMPLVAPGDPQHSYLYRKLLATADGRMPEGGPYLDAQALARVAGWICAGAPPPSDGGTSADAGFTLSSVSPPSVLVGSGALSLSLAGTGFGPTSVARFDQFALPTSLVDAGVLQASVDPAVTEAAAVHWVDVVDGLRTTGSLPFTVENPAPALEAISPSPVATNGAPFLLSVMGTGFTSTSRVSFNGGYVPTTYASEALLRAQIPSLTVPKSYPVYVDTPAPGGGTSATLSLVASNMTAPTITGLDPDPAPSGMTFALQVSGSGYLCSGSPSVVHLGASALSPATCSPTVLGVTAPALDAGTYPVQVENPSIAFSNAMDLAIALSTGTPALTSLSPDAGMAGSPAITLAASGSGFAPGAVVQWAGSALPTSFQSASELSASLSGAELADAGTYPVTVLNPPPGGGTSNALPFAVVRPNPVPLVSALSPCGGVAGGAAFVLTLAGTGFTAESTVTFRGTAVSVLSASDTSLQVSIPQALVSASSADDTVAVVVTNPPPGGGSSAPAYYGLAGAPSTLAGNVQAIFTSSCATAGCHVTSSPQVPMDLRAGHSYASLVGAPCTECPPRLRVLACGPLPSQSYLMAKLLATDVCSGTRMPKSAPLSSTDIQTIRDWIAQGAPP